MRRQVAGASVAAAIIALVAVGCSRKKPRRRDVPTRAEALARIKPISEHFPAEGIREVVLFTQVAHKAKVETVAAAKKIVVTGLPVYDHPGCSQGPPLIKASKSRFVLTRVGKTLGITATGEGTYAMHDVELQHIVVRVPAGVRVRRKARDYRDDIVTPPSAERLKARQAIASSEVIRVSATGVRVIELDALAALKARLEVAADSNHVTVVARKLSENSVVGAFWRVEASPFVTVTTRREDSKLVLRADHERKRDKHLEWLYDIVVKAPAGVVLRRRTRLPRAKDRAWVLKMAPRRTWSAALDGIRGLDIGPNIAHSKTEKNAKRVTISGQPIYADTDADGNVAAIGEASALRVVFTRRQHVLLLRVVDVEHGPGRSSSLHDVTLIEPGLPATHHNGNVRGGPTTN
ncbi:MAG: hypothetical protein KC503_15160 [Myxococcales bacterium]|nr:hypothetical protein [Myxococcales bacterium]